MQILSKNLRVSTHLAGALVLGLLASCASIDQNEPMVTAGMAKVDLRVSDVLVSDPTFTERTSVTVPQNHKVGDKIFPYEGIGWENELVGYRLYLDERSVTDIFGKKTPEPVLGQVDYRNDYHSMADWGMDIMKVGPSMGVGGLGLYRGDRLERFGPDANISATVLKGKGAEVSFKVVHDTIPLIGGRTGKVEATYSLKSGNPLTWVKVKSSMPKETLATGLVKSKGNKRFRNSNSVEKGEWSYIATWGDTQSESKDGLGTILFYRKGEARLMPTVNDTYALRFNNANPNYAFAGVWEQGPMNLSDEKSFIQWANEQQKQLNK